MRTDTPITLQLQLGSHRGLHIGEAQRGSMGGDTQGLVPEVVGSPTRVQRVR